MCQAPIVQCAICSRTVSDPIAHGMQCAYCYRWHHCSCISMQPAERQKYAVLSCGSCVAQGKFSALKGQRRTRVRKYASCYYFFFFFHLIFFLCYTLYIFQEGLHDEPSYHCFPKEA